MTSTTKRYFVNTADELSRSCTVLRSTPNGPAIWTKERRLEQSEIVGMIQDRNGMLSWTVRRPIRGWYLHIVHPAAINEQPMASLRPPRGGVSSADSLVFDIRTRGARRKGEHGDDDEEGLLSSLSPQQQASQNAISNSNSSSTSIPISTASITSTSPSSATSPSAASFSFKSHRTSTSIHSRRSSTIHPLAASTTTAAAATITGTTTSSQNRHGHIIQYIPQHEDNSLITSHFVIEPEEVSPSLSSVQVHQTQAQEDKVLKNETFFSKVLSFAPNVFSFQKWLKSSTDNFILRDPNRPHITLARYQDQSSLLAASTAGILTLNTIELDKEYENNEAFWIAVMLAYLEYGEDKEAYQAAQEG